MAELTGQGVGSVNYATLLNGNFHKPDDLLPKKHVDLPVVPQLPEAIRHDAALAREASPWLDKYIAFSKTWSPRAHCDFHESVGLWLLSTVAARRVALDLGKRRYTNLYIALAARTSIYAKSTTAEIAQAVLKEAGLSHLMAPDDATPQAFVKMLTYVLPADWNHLSQTKRDDILRRLAFAAQRGWYFDEFGQKISAMMRDGGFMGDFRSLLRKFDDTPDIYEYVTIGRGTDLVYRPYLSLLANLTPDDLKPYAKRGASLWGDGFWARFAFITPTQTNERKRGRFPERSRLIPPDLIRTLQVWHKRLGIPPVEVFDVTDGDGKQNGKQDLLSVPMKPKLCTLADGVFDAFYGYNDALLDIVAESQYSDLDGNYARFAEKALRVAMLLASLENDNHIEMKHWARAQQIAETWRINLHNLYSQVVSTVSSKAIQVEEKIMQKIVEKGPMTRRELYQYIPELNSQQAGIVLDSMVKAGLLDTFPDGRTERYRLTG